MKRKSNWDENTFWNSKHLVLSVARHLPRCWFVIILVVWLQPLKRQRLISSCSKYSRWEFTLYPFASFLFVCQRNAFNTKKKNPRRSLKKSTPNDFIGSIFTKEREFIFYTEMSKWKSVFNPGLIFVRTRQNTFSFPISCVICQKALWKKLKEINWRYSTMVDSWKDECCWKNLSVSTCSIQKSSSSSAWICIFNETVRCAYINCISFQ